MWLVRPTRLAALLIALALAFAPTLALADGDPASDILLIQDTFFPYQSKVSPNIQTAVNQAVARAKAAGFPLKVAVISGPTDLGAVPDLFGKPQQYADFLDREISFNKTFQLLVVMPQGFGLSHAGPATALATTRIPAGSGGDPLGRAALVAVGALAAHAGHPIALPKIGAASGSTGGGTPAALTFGAPIALIALVGIVLILRGRRTDPEAAIWEDEDDDEDEEAEAATDADRPADGPAATDAPDARSGERSGSSTDPAENDGIPPGGDPARPAEGGTPPGGDPARPAEGGTPPGGDPARPAEGGTPPGGDPT